MNKAFSIKEAVQFGWQTTLKNFWFFAGLVLILFVVRLIGNMFQGMMWSDAQHGNNGWVSLIMLIIGLVLQMGTIRIALKFVDGKKADYSDLWSNLNEAPHFILAMIMMAAIAFVGTLLLIVPGVIAAVGLSMVSYLVIDKKMKGVAVIKESWRMTKGYKWSLFGFTAVMALINIVGALLLAIGLFWTIPTSMLATAFVYRKLSGAIKVEEKTAVEVPMVPVADIA